MSVGFGQAAVLAGSAMWREANRIGGDVGGAIGRRAALARQPRPEGTGGPALRFLLGELTTWALPGREAHAPSRALHPQPVMVLPGFGAHPRRMARLMRALSDAGHSPHEWGLGFNFGPTAANFAFLLRRVRALARAHEAPVVLVGWSLGGLFAREIARLEPDCVAKVITMGTPFSGDRRANNAWRAYELVTGHGVDAPPIPGDFAAKPPVPTIALWSPRDGVVQPRAACGRRGERDRAVALRCTHLGFAGAPEVIVEVLRQLDRED